MADLEALNQKVQAARDRLAPLYEQIARVAAISAAGIRNYSIYRFGTLLFSYWEYEGENYESDLAAIDRVPECVRWNDLMATLQVPIEGAQPRSWTPLPEVFHLD